MGFDSGKKAREELIQQFFVTLRVTFDQAKLGARAKQAPEVVARVETLLAVPSWRSAYEIEQLQVLLLDEVAVATALAGRIEEAQAVLPESDAASYRAQAAAAKGKADAERALLGRLVDDLQWKYQNREFRRELESGISSTSNRAFVVTMVVIGALLLGREWNLWRAPDLVFASAAGAWGAGFSILTSLKARLDRARTDELKTMILPVFTASRLFIGLGAGAALYMLLVSGVLAGEGFPNLHMLDPESTRQRATEIARASLEARRLQAPAVSVERLAEEVACDHGSTAGLREACRELALAVHGATATPESITGLAADLRADLIQGGIHEQRRLPTAGLMLLIVWCVVAGFSEKLVPNLLSRKEKGALADTPAA